MNALLITLCLAYLAAVLWFLHYRYLPRTTTIRPEAKENPRYKLALNTHKLLGFVHWVLLTLAIIWTPAQVVLLVLSVTDPGHTPGDITIYANLDIDFAALPQVAVDGLSEQVLSASTALDLRAPNVINFFLFALTSLIKILLTLFVVLHIRNALASYCNGDSFTAGNSRRLKEVGMVVTFAYLVGPFWNLFLSASVIKAISIDSAAFTLTPAGSGSWLGLFVGVGLIILSGVIGDAEQLEREQRFTI